MTQIDNHNKKIIANKQIPAEVMIGLAYLVFIIIMSFLSPTFFTVKNFLNIGQQSAIMGVVATGMTVVLLSGGIDISVAGTMALIAMLIATTITKTTDPVLAVLLGMGAGAICGFLNGIAITKAKILPLIATLATSSMFRGFAYLTTNGVSVAITNTSFTKIGRGYFLGIPISIYITIASFAIFALILKFTPFGRKIYAVGGNSQASRLSGINVSRIRLIVYSICGMMAGLGGVITAAQAGAGIANANEGMEMQAISAVVLGGTSMHGGKGNIFGTFIGVLILVTLNNGMNLLGVQTFWKMVIKGMVLIIAVIVDSIRGGGYE
ncbi:MAG: ABC transporter permease [Flexilinea sp.]